MNSSSSAEQPIIQHLLELRSRLLRSLACVALVFAGLFAFANEIYQFVARPLQRFLPEDSSMIATDIASPFLTPFKLVLLVSILISIPYLLYQVWAFVAPALYRNEKRIALPLFVASVLLFYSGMAFAYYLVLPLAFQFFISVAPAGIAAMPDITKYLDFVIKMMFGFGLAFEVPVATVMLIAAGAVNPESLEQKRSYIIVGCFVLGMLLTPPDVFSQIMLAVPMWMLFEAGLFFGKLVVKHKAADPSDETS